MEIINEYEKSQNNWTIRPGAVGSVGDVNMQVRLKGNMPDSKIRYDKDFSGKNEKFYGSNVQDGAYGSGGSARVIDRKFGSRPGHKTSIGWRFQDVIPVDRKSDTVLSPLGPYTWNNKRAEVVRAKVSGQNFLPEPMGYNLSLLQSTQSVARGNQTPRVVLTESGSTPLANVSGSVTTQALNQNVVTNPYTIGPVINAPVLDGAPGPVANGKLRPPIGRNF